MDPTEIYEDTPQTKSRRGLWAALALVILIVMVASAVAYVAMVNKPKAATTTASVAPQVPTKKEVGQIMTSVDSKINQAAADQAAASAALQQASTPVKVDL